MKTGWTISITDSHAKDKVYKFISGDRRKACTKRAEYQSRYDTIEEGRFKVEIDAQYSEFAEEGSSKVRCTLLGDVDSKDLRDLLMPFDVFIGEKDNGYEVELPTRDVEDMQSLLENSDMILSSSLVGKEG